jgi:hypothetical protein
MSYAVVCFALLLSNPESVESQADLNAEQAAAVREVERAARDFRILVYETYRTDRPEYDARRLSADKLLEAWYDAGHPAAYREDVLQWYREATKLAAETAVGVPEMPELPDPLPEAVAGEGESDPAFPNRVNVPVRKTRDRSPWDRGDADFFAPQTKGTYGGPKYTPASQIFRSIQRALLSSASADPAEAEQFEVEQFEFEQAAPPQPQIDLP